MIDRLGQDCPVALAVSLHAPLDALRDNLVPLNRKYPIEELLQACARYQAHAPRDFITFEYCMLDGVNDTKEDALRLVDLLQGIPAKVNLIPYNTVTGLEWERPDEHVQEQFLRVLVERGAQATLRREKGHDIAAACGQLRLQVTRQAD